MPQFQTYAEDTITGNDKVLYYKANSNALKTTTFTNLVAAIRTALNSFFTSATVVPSTAPAAGRILVGNAGNTAYAAVAVSGDGTLSSTGALTIGNQAITPAKVQHIEASKLWGRGAGAGTGVGQPITIGTGLSFDGTTLNVSAGTGNVTQTTDATEANRLFVSGGADKSRIETPITIDPGTGDMDGIGELAVEDIAAPQISISATHATDDTAHGIVISDINAGETIAQWETVYFDFAEGEWMKADANAAGKFPAAGLAMAAGTNGGVLDVLTRGTVRNDAWNWVSGPIYLSLTAGGLTQTAPSTTGEAVQHVGFAITADKAYFNFTTHTLVP